MILNEEHIYLRFLEESDSVNQLNLKIRNRNFFENYLFTVDDDYYTIEQQRKSLIHSKKLLEKGQEYLFGVFLKETNQLVGNIIISGVTRGSLQSCNLGYFLDQSQNGKGFTTKAVHLAIKYIFNDLKLHRIEAKVMPNNIGSIRVLEKLGFQKEGLCRKNALINGVWEDHYSFSLLTEEFNENEFGQL